MATKVTREQIRTARVVNLHQWLYNHHTDLHYLNSKSWHPNFNKSISIAPNYKGYFDFATQEHGNAVDYLTKYLGYQFPDAVLALIGEGEEIIPIVQNTNTEVKEDNCSFHQRKPFTPPSRCHSNDGVIKYLVKKRYIDLDIVNRLIAEDKLYEDNEHVHHNAVFINEKGCFGEIRGIEEGSNWHGMVRGTAPNSFWYVNDFKGAGNRADAVLICESAIDAISLMQIFQLRGADIGYNFTYVSIGGVAKQGAIDKIKKMGRAVIIAVDNDSAGNECRGRNKDCKSFIPKGDYKDWNAQLIGTLNKEKEPNN